MNIELKTILKPTFFFLVTILLLVYSSCKREESSRKFSLPPLKIQTGEVKLEKVPIIISTFGYLRAIASVDVRPQVNGVIKKTLFYGGKKVKKGDLLAVIDYDKYMASLDANEALLKQDMASLELKEYIFNKDLPLYKSGAMSEQQFRQLVADIKSARSRVQYDKANILKDKINIKNCYIKAPIDGIVGFVGKGSGDLVSSLDIICNIRDLKSLYVEFSIPGNYILPLKASMESDNNVVYIIAKSLSKSGTVKEGRIPGVLKFVDNNIDPGTGKIKVEAIINNEKGRFYPGEFVKVELNIGEGRGELLVPQSAIQFDINGGYLFLIENGIAKRVNVSIDKEYKGFFVVKSKKIKSGDKVAITGLELLTTGRKVIAIKD